MIIKYPYAPSVQYDTPKINSTPRLFIKQTLDLGKDLGTIYTQRGRFKVNHAMLRACPGGEKK